MMDSTDADRWQRVLTTLLAACWYRESAARAAYSFARANRCDTEPPDPIAPPTSAARPPTSRVPAVRHWERRTGSSIEVSWCDPASANYGEQIWTKGVARRRCTCALSGSTIESGDAIYRPKYTRGNIPANADQTILAAALDSQS
ncbi:DUF3331 domain-containing protein [Burkholderia sp. BDU5]|uniref:DUF3331 domain-containing protein n=1 Tax=Burkholderia sp. BDU5 TaxID=1385590 RepID=UPI0009EB9FCE|nr:DUF3331 domain-containing protein [Burkholderia sp. BDU5]